MNDRIETSANLGEKAGASTNRATIAANPKIRAGIVGAGLMGHWHAHALEKVGGEVIAIVDFDTAKAERLAADYPNAKSFETVEKMLAAQDIDVLHVCSPTASHELIAETAIEAGVHLLVEKPVAATAKKTVELYDLAARRETFLCPVHQFVFQDGTAKAKKRLADIGRVVHLEARICSAGGDGLGGERIDQIAADILPHPLSMAQKFIEDDISQIDWNVLHPGDGELRIFGQESKGASLSFFISMNSRPTSNSFHLYGSNGTIHLDLFHGFSIVEPGSASKTGKILHPFDLAARNFTAATVNLAQRIVRRESAYPGLRQLIREFYAAIKDGAELPIKPAEAIAVAEIRDLLIARAGIAPTV